MKNLLISLLFVLASTSVFAADRSLTQTGVVMKSFAVTCATTATLVEAAAGETYTSLQCSALGAVEIFLGGPDVSTANGYPVCTDPALCGVSTQGIASNNLYCRVAAATEELRCLAVVR